MTEDSVYMVLYSTYVAGDFSSTLITTYAGPFASRETGEYWIENNPEEYVTNMANYPDPMVQEHPIRELEDLQ